MKTNRTNFLVFLFNLLIQDTLYTLSNHCTGYYVHLIHLFILSGLDAIQEINVLVQ